MIFHPAETFDTLGITTLGYEKALQLPFVVKVIDPTKPIVFDQDLFFGVCKDVCIPVTHPVKFDISPPMERTTFDGKSGTEKESFVRNNTTTSDTNTIIALDSEQLFIESRFTPSYIQIDKAGILSILFISFIAGFILNFMPCVFPVLSLKVLAISHANRTSMAYMSMGIISVFIIIGAVISLAKTSFGWGFQFQYIWFVALMNILLVFMVLNLWDKFYIRIPDRLVQFFPQGSSQKGRAFFDGVVMTLLATPCSAPFVGTALGIALGLSPYYAMLIFISMGIGMALPCIVVYCVPSLAQKLPKQGAWMQQLKHILSIPIIALIVFLLYIQTMALPIPFAIISIICIALIAILLWVKLVYSRFIVGIAYGCNAWYKRGRYP